MKPCLLSMHKKQPKHKHVKQLTRKMSFQKDPKDTSLDVAAYATADLRENSSVNVS